MHGSLARAGKVRGQTPKVAKAEKPHGKAKNDLRGRSKKRMQYNKRYVNVVVGMGGKKVGPNSQAGAFIRSFSRTLFLAPLFSPSRPAAHSSQFTFTRPSPPPASFFSPPPHP